MPAQALWVVMATPSRNEGPNGDPREGFEPGDASEGLQHTAYISGLVRTEERMPAHDEGIDADGQRPAPARAHARGVITDDELREATRFMRESSAAAAADDDDADDASTVQLLHAGVKDRAHTAPEPQQIPAATRGLATRHVKGSSGGSPAWLWTKWVGQQFLAQLRIVLPVGALMLLFE